MSDLTLEEIDAIELPTLPADRTVKSEDYYPFERMGWDTGKAASYRLGNLPTWSIQCCDTWFFYGIDATAITDTLTISHGYHGTGKIVIRPKDGTIAENLQRIAPLLRSACVSTEQKRATCGLFFYRLFDLVEQKKPDVPKWSG